MSRLTQLCISGLCALGVLASASTAHAIPLVDKFSVVGTIQVTPSPDGIAPASITFPGTFTVLTQNATIDTGPTSLVGFTGLIGGTYTFVNPGANTTTALGGADSLFQINDLSAHIDGLRAFAAGAGDADAPCAPAARRFLELRRVYGGSCGPSEVAFRHADGALIAPGGLVSFLRDIRMTRRGVEANGEMCRVLLKARIADPAPAE
jgi:hypothetical protein